MKQLPLVADEIKALLAGIPGAEVGKVEDYLTEGRGEKGIHFFKIAYDRGELIMPKGAYSDYIAIHLQGVVRVFDQQPAQQRDAGCWTNERRSLWSWLWPFRGKGTSGRERALADPTASSTAAFDLSKGIPISTRIPPPTPPSQGGDSSAPPLTKGGPGGVGEVKPLLDRIMGVAGALWNQPRSVSLVADDDGTEPCQMFLIKRKAFLDLLPRKKAEKFYQEKEKEFLSMRLAELLGENELFRPRLYLEDIAETDWPQVVSVLQGVSTMRLARRQEAKMSAADRIRAALDEDTRRRINELMPENLDKGAKYWILDAFNRLLQHKGGSGLNVRDMKEAFPDLFHTRAEELPSTREEFKPFVDRLREWGGTDLLPRVFEKKKAKDAPLPVLKEKAPSQTLHLILNGRFRVTREMQAGGLLVNHLEKNEFFGESCLLEGATYTANVEAVAVWNQVLALDRKLVVRLAAEFPAFEERLRRELGRSRLRDVQRAEGHRRPPVEPPHEAATKLLMATNLLVIDMDLCTRCDQCVRACTEAHGGKPRFHRANPHSEPSLRFGKWEVAAACVHCSDAPCLPACPVGAITFLDEGSVHIHRNRCIGCTACANKCPFEVIEMLAPISALDAPSLDVEKKKDKVATKCDLCLTDKPDPPCVVACPYEAARRGTPQEIFPEINRWTAAE